jgi:hypothetical protein
MDCDNHFLIPAHLENIAGFILDKNHICVLCVLNHLLILAHLKNIAGFILDKNHICVLYVRSHLQNQAI